MSSNYCVVCGAEIPEGRQVCPSCEAKSFGWPADQLEGTPIDRLNDDSRLKDRWRD